MPREWVVVVNLGSLAMVGVGIIFLVVWMFDRRRWSVLSFAVAIFAYNAATLVLSTPMPAATAASIHGVLFPISMILLIDGLVLRSGGRIRVPAQMAFVAGQAVVVWYFAYISPLLVGRIVTQSIGLLTIIVVAVQLMVRRGLPTTSDRVSLVATVALGLSVCASLGAAAVSPVPRELSTDADMQAYLASGLELAIIVTTAVLLPLFVMTMLGVTIADVIVDLKYQRDRDELTGVFNRWGFNQRARQSMRGARSALVLVDLDRFKAVNDALGHAVGDAVLAAVAAELRDAGGGAIVGRMGGEEFAVLLPDTGLDDAVAWAEAVRCRVESRAIEVAEQRVNVTVSLGVTHGAPAEQLADLLEAADRAMYRAKAHGRNRVAVDT